MKTIKRIFKWGVSQELVPNEVYQALATVEGARKGRGKIAAQTHEPRKVLPVPPADVEKTITAAGPEIGAMIRVQLLCGMRPDEVTIMRPCDIEQPKKGCWTYRPTAHKTAWQGHDKEILIGPKAQKILKPFINECASPTDFLFSPRRVTERWIEQKLREAGKEPNLVRLREKKPPRECYDDQSYAQAVRRACRRAKVDEWTPNRLRHNAGTTIRAQFGAEAAKLVLGHRHLSTTEIYAEKDREKYEQIIRKCG